MPGPRGNPAQREQVVAERRRKVSALYTAYLTQREIAEQLGVSAATINGDIAWIRKSLLTDTGEIVDREKAALDKLQKEAALQYEATKAVEWHHDQLAIMKRRADLFGLDKPKKIAPTNPEGTEALPIFTEIIMVKPAAAAGDADD